MWPFVLVAVLIVALAVFSLSLMSSVRAYIGGESYWSKGQKDAVFYLNLYAQTGNENVYRQYQTAIACPQSLKIARMVLDRREPDLAVARQALIDSGVYPGDIRDVIWVFLTFRHVSYFDEAVRYWAGGDAYVDRLARVGDALHAAFEKGQPEHAEIEQLIDQIWYINATIAPLSRAFSDVLSVSFRKTASLLLVVNLVIAILLISLATWHARRLIVQRIKSEEALKRSEARAKATLGSIGEAVISIDRAGNIEFINPTAERLTTCRASECLGKPLTQMFTLIDENQRVTVDPVGTALSRMDGEAAWGNLILIRRDGLEIIVQAVTSPISDSSDGHTGVVLVLRNMTREREYVANLAWQATHDGLTGLFNRVEFERRLLAELTRDGRAPHCGPAAVLMFLDLDQFKVVNDTCGHAAGDAMLCEVAARFQTCLRERDTLARLGGDEFGVLLRDCGADDAELFAERLRSSLEGFTFHWATHPFTTSVSIGVVELQGMDVDAEEAMRLADIACYMAKERGRDRVQLANRQDHEISRHASEISWGRRIKEALEQDLFCLYVQSITPIGRPADDPQHVELLIRMVDESGIIAPGMFIPAAERYGLMSAIDRWVVKRAFATLAAMDSRSRGIHYAINLSGASIGDERFLEFLRGQFLQTGVPAELICFEVTETTAVRNLAAAVRFIRELKGLGCKFALDDFGAGMSSFAYLKHLPVDYLKIDGSFVQDMLNDQVNRDMVAAINDIGHSMGHKTIAEYVESEAILALLREIGVDFAQGYHIGKPTLWNEQHRLFVPEEET
jgi:diguanylate cyclase (GGDEF)-like protein/PAS domain S-box-containing protein